MLDLFAGVGGTAVGYHRAGFDVVGVDTEPQPDYPFEFVRADALRTLLDPAVVRDFDVIHASPPCQASTALTKGTNRETRSHLHTNLIPATRELLKLTGLPFVIENVQGAQVRRDLTLCGEMFGLGVIRHRYFEVEGLDVTPPEHLPHRGRVAGMRHGQWFTGPYFAVYGEGGGKGTVAQWREAMGIDWTWDRRSIAEAIPPAYTEYVGLQLAEQLREAA